MHRRVIYYCGTSIVLAVALIFSRDSLWLGNDQLHTIMEISATILALIVGALALVRFYTKKNNIFLFIGIGFVGAGLLDCYHAIVTAEVFRSVMPSESSSLIAWSWLASRQFLSVMLFLSWLGAVQKERGEDATSYGEIIIYLGSSCFLMASFLFFAFVPLPPAYFPEFISPRPEEFVPAFFFAIALFGYIKKGQWRSDPFEHWIVMSLIVGVITQTLFMPFSSEVFDAEFDLAHLLKKVSYVCVLIGLLISMYGVFKNEAESGERYSGIIDNTAEAVLSIDVKGLIETFNPSAERIFGYQAKDAIGRNVAFLMPGNQQARHDTYLRNSILQTSRSFGEETMLRGQRKDGSIFPLELTVSRMDIRGQKKFIGILRDITTSKQALEYLRVSEERFQDFATAVADRFWELDENYQFIFLSGVKGIFENSPDKLIGKTHEVFDIELIDSPYSSFMEVLKLNQPIRDLRYKLIKSDGSFAFIREAAIPLFDSNGKFLGYRGAAIDETKSVVAQKISSEVQERFKYAMENLDAGFALWDSDDRLVGFNSFFQNIINFGANILELHITFEEYVKQWVKYSGRLGPDDSLEEYVQKRVKQFSEPRSAVEIQLPNSTWVNVVMQKLSDGSTIILYTDISQQHEREEELRHAREVAEIANEAKSNFLSSMSHELRTPMNAILGFGQLLQSDPGEPLSEQQENYTNQILKGGELLLELIDQVLELSRIEAGKIDISIEKIDAVPIVDECFAMLRERAEESNITLINNIGDKELPLLRVDSSRLRQILLNLMTNAIKYNFENGSVTIESEVLDNRFLRLYINDTGMGIPSEHQDKLFEPFNRLGRENGEIEGTGIGLTITKQYVELLFGHIGYTSEEGKGSSFWIDVPVDLGETNPVDENNKTEDSVKIQKRNIEKVSAVSSSTLDEKTILYIEDNSSNRLLMEEVIGGMPGMKILLAETGELGLDMAQKHIPDLILMDINLPGMDGIEVKESLGMLDVTKDIPVIALTAAAMLSDIERGNQAGFVDYVTKPIDIPIIVSSIKSVFGQV